MYDHNLKINNTQCNNNNNNNNNNDNKNKSLYLSVKVLSTTVLIEDTEMSQQIL